MRSTPLAPAIPPPARDPEVPVEVLGQDAAATLRVVVEQRRLQDAAAARELAAVAHWAELHRVDTRTEVGAVDLEGWRLLEDRLAHDPTATTVAATTGLLGREGELRLAGEGAFTVAEFAVTELAAALGLSEPAAREYVGQAVELRDRLPRCWDQVMAGRLPAWKARRIARETIPLTGDAASYVDAQLAPFAARLSVTRILRAVGAGILRHDPESAAQRARDAAEHRGVWLDDGLDGTTRIEAVTGTPDAAAFDTAVGDVAATLAALGDADQLQVRRAKAVGVLADPQYALDLVATVELAATSDGPAALPTRSSTGRPAARPGPVLHVHLHTTAADVGTRDAEPVEPVARVCGGGATTGARPTTAVVQWLRDLTPGATVRVTPVVDLTRRYAVNAYEVPDRLRAQVERRDDGCRFPWCGRAGAYDVDHVDRYRFTDPERPGGPAPPGQTASDNLARLCRYHHRVKTHTDWDYRRAPTGVLVWTSPLGATYLVDETGTYPRDGDSRGVRNVHAPRRTSDSPSSLPSPPPVDRPGVLTA